MTDITIQFQVNSGTVLTGVAVVAASATVDLRLASYAGVQSIRWEVQEFPAGFSQPSGWSTDSDSGVYYYNASPIGGLTPPTITMPNSGQVSAGQWGKWLFRAIATIGGKIVVSNPRCGVRIPSPNLGLHGLAATETTEFGGSQRAWAGEVDGDEKVMDGAIGGASASAPYVVDATSGTNASDRPLRNLNATLAAKGNNVPPITRTRSSAQASGSVQLDAIYREVSDNSGHGADGSGGFLSIYIPNSSGTDTEAARIESLWSSVAGPSSKLVLHTRNAGTLGARVTIAADGTVTLAKLAGSGSGLVAVDNNGNLSFTSGGSGADASAYYVTNAASAVNANDAPLQNLSASLAFKGNNVPPITIERASTQASGSVQLASFYRSVTDNSGHGTTGTGGYLSIKVADGAGAATEAARIEAAYSTTLGPQADLKFYTYGSGTIGLRARLSFSGTWQWYGYTTGFVRTDGSGNVTSSGLTFAEINATLAAANATININGQDLSGVGNLNVGGDAVISGNLTVSGTTTTVNSTAVSLADRLVVFNSSTGVVPAPTQIAGFVIDRGSADGVTKRDAPGLFWDEASTSFDFAYNTTLDQSSSGSFVGIKVGGLTISGFGSGILHSSSGGVVTSSPVVDSDVATGAAIQGLKIAPDFGSQNIQTTGSITAGAAGFIGPQINLASSGTFTFGSNIATAAFSSAALTGVASVANSGGALALSSGAGAATLDSDSSHHTQVGASSAQAVDVGHGTITITLTGLQDGIYAGLTTTKTAGRQLRNTSASSGGTTVRISPSDVWEGRAFISSTDKALRYRQTLVPKTSSNLDFISEYDTGGGTYSTAWYFTTATPNQFLAAVVCSGFAATQGATGFFFDANDSGLQLTGSSGLTLVSYETGDSLRLRGEATGSTDPIRIWASGETKTSSKAIVAFGSGSTWAQASRIAGDGVYEGPVLRNSAVKTANYSAALWDLVEYSTAGGTFTITLPSPSSSNKGQLIAIKNAGGTDTPVTVSTPSGAIDNASSTTVQGGWGSAILVSDGGNGYLTLAKTQGWNWVGTKTGAYTTAVGEFVDCDPSGGGFTVTLPTGPTVNTGREIDVVIKNITSSTNTITVAAAGGQTIDGASTATITTARGSLSLSFKPGGTDWRIR